MFVMFPMEQLTNHDNATGLEWPGSRITTEEGSMNGAESVVHTLVGSGVDTCFTNPGTSEMHFVAALDRVPGVRCVLALFEGVATGSGRLCASRSKAGGDSAALWAGSRQRSR
jgi:hypothetical protein